MSGVSGRRGRGAPAAGEDEGAGTDAESRTHLWMGSGQRVWLDRQEEPALFFALQPWVYIDYAEPCG